jgi:hypothetical protein
VIPFAGPSYQLETRKASQQRSVNLFLAGMETQSKAAFILQSAPGLDLATTGVGVTRGVLPVGGRLFGVFGSGLYEIGSTGALTLLGSLASSTGECSMEYGLTQLVVVDGTRGYVLTLSSNAFAQITDPDWPGANFVSYLDGFFVLTREGSQEAYVTAIDDATSLDALDFASAESRPDPIVAHIVSNREVVYLGQVTTERHFNAGSADYPFSRDGAANTEVGCLAPFSVKPINNSFMWVSRDVNGVGYVMLDANRQPQRVSTVAVEEALQGSSDLSAAVAYTYQQGGRMFYALNAPGVPATWVYEATAQAWHERCDLDGWGQFRALRVTHAAFAHGVQWAFDASGNVYRMGSQYNTYAGDTLKRTRISPNDVTATRDRQFFSEFSLDCTTGEAPQATEPMVELSWSDDGGYTWGNPVAMSAGAVGNYLPRVTWCRLGSARDRVWRVDFAANAPFAIIDAVAR